MLPIIALFRELSKLKTYEALVKKATALGLEPFKLDIPVRRDVMKIVDQSIYRQSQIVVQMAHAVASEQGREFSILSLGLSDTTERFDDVVKEISTSLSAQPEFPAASAQFVFLENESGRTSISLAHASGWVNSPEGSLAHIAVSPFQSGVMISQSVQTAK
jgi:hypothetical protein